MEEKYVNGRRVPFELSVEELTDLCKHGTMEEFCVACEALSAKNDRRAYDVLRSYLSDSDKYKHYCALKTVFRMPFAAELGDELEKALCDPYFWFVSAALSALCHSEAVVSERLLKDTVRKYFDRLDEECYVLARLWKTEENFLFIRKLFSASKECHKQEVLSAVLIARFGDLHPQELFALFSASKFGKIRQKALLIGRSHGYDLTPFRDDPDGHVRALYARVLA